jgi:cell cycle checkpoint protein
MSSAIFQSSKSSSHTARAYIPFSLFDEYKYKPDPHEAQSSQDADPEGEVITTFTIPLDTLLECLNIFGTGSSSLSQASLESRKRKKWKKDSDESDEDKGRRGKGRKGGPPKGNATIDQYFWSNSEKKTGMRMSYSGSGHPLTLIL